MKEAGSINKNTSKTFRSESQQTHIQKFGTGKTLNNSTAANTYSGAENFRKTPNDLDDSLSKMLATHDHYQFGTQRVNSKIEDMFEEKKSVGNEETNDIRSALMSPNLSTANYNSNLPKSPFDYKKKDLIDLKADYSQGYQRSGLISNGGMNVVSGESFKKQNFDPVKNQTLYAPNKHLRDFVDDKQGSDQQGNLLFDSFIFNQNLVRLRVFRVREVW